MARDNEAEVIIVGGGPAGLSAAIYLARYGRSVALFDIRHGRSTHHQVNRNYLGFPGGIRTTELRQRGLDQLSVYDHVYLGHHRVERLELFDGGSLPEDSSVARTGEPSSWQRACWTITRTFATGSRTSGSLCSGASPATATSPGARRSWWPDTPTTPPVRRRR